MNPNHQPGSNVNINVERITPEGTTEFLNRINARYGESDATPDLQAIMREMLQEALAREQQQ